MFRGNDRKRALRRGWFIHGYTGPNGGGKSTAIAQDTIASLDAGRPVLSTMRLVDYANPRECIDDACEADPLSGHYVRELPEPHIVDLAFEQISDPRERVEWLASAGSITRVHQVAHPLWIPLVDWQQVLDARGVDLLLDEVTGAASSRESASLPAAVANKLVQLRRADVTVRWSAPNWARADKILRECSQAVTYCTGHLPKDSGDAQRRVRQRRMFRWRTYDANAFEDFTAGKRAELPTLCNEWFWGPRSDAFKVFDTYDAVLSVGTVTESGTCYRCGGTRRRPQCRCSDNHDVRAATDPARGPRVRGGAGEVASAAVVVVPDPEHVCGDDTPVPASDPSPVPVGLE